MAQNEVIGIEQKTVNFHGADLMAVKANNGKVYVGMQWIGQGIGFTKDKIRNEIRKAAEDKVVTQGVSNLTLPTQGGYQEAYCIDIEYLPLWLAKISITPTIEKEQPEVANSMVRYQLKAKDVLAEAFLRQPTTQLQILQQTIAALVDQEKKINTIEEQMSDIKETIIHTDQDWRKWINTQISKVAVSWGNEPHHHSEARNQSYKLLETRARCRLDTRLVNIRNRMAFNGATRSKIDATNNLDVIENVPRLKEIYTTIVKEMALKYTV